VAGFDTRYAIKKPEIISTPKAEKTGCGIGSISGKRVLGLLKL
jgi:hypothetical protein